MLVTPLPGTDAKSLLKALQHVYDGAVTARGAGGGDNLLRYDAYHGWALHAMRTLRGKIAPADLEQLVLTRTFWTLQAPGISGLSFVARLVDVELDDRMSVFEAACKDLEAQIARWSRDGVFVVADTSFYIQHPQEMDDLDLREHLGIRGEPVHLLVPILVVDELDGSSRTMFELGPVVRSQSSIVSCPTQTRGMCCVRETSRLSIMEGSLAVR